MNAVSDFQVARGTRAPGLLVAVNGGPPLVTNGGGFALVRRPARHFTVPGLRVVSGRGPCRAVGFRPAHRSYSAVSSLVSAGVCLSRMICSTSAGV